ncbi:MAG: peptidase M23 [Rhodobacteraceae bacterium]|nr:peptidase M23 [Paracoccaceae bacterium]
MAALATPAMAHGGAHLHPHGIDHLGLSLGLLAVAVAAGVALWGRK